MRRFSGALNRADAEDAVSDVIIRLHRRMLEGRVPDNLRAAFFTSVRNAAIDQLRSQAAKPTVGLETVAAPSDTATPLEYAERREEAVRLQEALQRMRGNYREAIVLRFGLGLTVPEIARHLSISLPAAKKLVLRATQQAKKRLESIEGAEFCPEMRETARRSLFEKGASGLASKGETEILHAHFQHCGSCKSFLTSLHDSLHEFGSSALLATVATDQLDGRIGILHHLTRWGSDAVQGAQVGGGKARIAAYKATAVLQSTDGGTTGLLTGTGQKIAAICSAGAATTATCLLTGAAGPGVGLSAPPPQHAPAPPAKVRAEPTAVAEEPSPAPELEPEPAPEPNPEPPPAPEPNPEAPAERTDTAAPAPAVPVSESAPAQSAPTSPASEFGLEGGSSSTSAPPTSTSTSGSGSPSNSSSNGSNSGSASVGSGGGGSESTSGGGGGGGSIGFQK
jgi:RNA polymerase sigma factor (sigma-70 family)